MTMRDELERLVECYGWHGATEFERGCATVAQALSAILAAHPPAESGSHCPGCIDPSAYAADGCPGLAEHPQTEEQAARKRLRVKAGSPEHVALWDAINRYAESCGGKTGGSGSAHRYLAVVNVEGAIQRALDATEKPER